jgi:hypothetical protein
MIFHLQVSLSSQLVQDTRDNNQLLPSQAAKVVGWSDDIPSAG